MSSDLQFLQELPEDELTELVVIPLLSKLGFKDIRYNHGSLERGKDIVCYKDDPLEGQDYYSFTIKSRKLDGTVSSNRSAREVLFQLQQALKTPYFNPCDGREILVDRAYFLTPFLISQDTILSILDELKAKTSSILFIDGPKLLSLINENVPMLLSYLPNPTRRYIFTIYQKLLQVETINSFGAKHKLTLNEIYTGGKVSSTTPEEAQYISFARPIAEQGAPFLEIFPNDKYIILLADVGAGKTTFLEKIAIDNLTRSDGSINDDPRLLPIILELTKIPPNTLNSYEHFRKWLDKQISEILGDPNFQLSSGSNLLLLLDGFDELPAGHEQLESYIANLPILFPSGIIMTSRPSRIPKLSRPFHYYKLHPFSDSDIEYFLGQWFRDDVFKSAEIFTRIIDNEHLLRFCRSPLLLTLYAAISSTPETNLIPTRRTEIYSQITTLLLGKWDEMRHVLNQFSADIKCYALELVAYNAHCNGRREFSIKELRTEIRSLLNSSRTYANCDERDFIDEIIYRSCMIHKTASGDYSFVHFSFQEYFSARHIFRFGDAKKVRENLYDSWWKNTLTFYFGLTRNVSRMRFGGKKTIGKGHVLLEYLAEADYSPVIVRQQVMEIIARQILLLPGDAPRELIDACRPLRDELTTALLVMLENAQTPAEKSDFTYKYLNFMISLGLRTADVDGQPLYLHDLTWQQRITLLLGLGEYLKHNHIQQIFEKIIFNLGKSINDDLSDRTTYDKINKRKMIHDSLQQLRHHIESPSKMDIPLLVRHRICKQLDTLITVNK